MTDIAKSINQLSPAKRELLLRQLQRRRQANSQQDYTLPPVEPDLKNRHEPFPLTEIQQCYWIGRSGLFELSAPSVNVYIEFDVVGVNELFAGLFNLAMQRLIQRHDMLRAVLLEDGFQRILPEAPRFEAEVIDRRGQDPEVLERELALNRERLKDRRTVVGHWPLFEFLLNILDHNRVRLQGSIDVFLVEGTSLTLMLNELTDLLLNLDLALPPLSFSYRDFALAWAARKQRDEYHRSKEYWLSRLDGMPPPPDFPAARQFDPTRRARLSNRYRDLLSSEEWSQLKSQGLQMGITPSGLVTAAFVEVISAHTRTSSFTVNLVGSYRPPMHPEINNVIGNFNTIFPLVIDAAASGFEERVKRIQQQVTSDLDHRFFTGFELLREVNRRSRNATAAPLPIFFNSVLEYSHASYQQWEYGSAGGQNYGPLPIEVIERGAYLPQVLLMPTVGETSQGGLTCKWQAIEDAFPDGFIEELANAYAEFISRLVREPELWHSPGRKSVVARRRGDAGRSKGPYRRLLESLERDDSADNAGAQTVGGADPASPPADDIETEIAGIIEAVLGRQGVRPDDDFFDLGGDSLSLARLLERLAARFQFGAGAALFSQGVSAARLAAALRAARAVAGQP